MAPKMDSFRAETLMNTHGFFLSFLRHYTLYENSHVVLRPCNVTLRTYVTTADLVLHKSQHNPYATSEGHSLQRELWRLDAQPS